MTDTEIKDNVNQSNTILFVCIIPLFILTLNAGLVYYYLKPLILISKRHANSVLLLCCQCCINCICNGILLPLFTQSKCCAEPWKYWKVVWSLFTIPNGIGVFYTTMYRVYICYYDICFNEALIDDQWRSQIDSTATQQNWFVKHRKTFGSRKWAQWYCFGMLAVFTLIISFTQQPLCPEIIMRGFVALSSLIPIVHITIVLIKLPGYADTIRLRQEIKYISIYSLILIIYYMVFVFVVQPQHNSIAFTIMCGNYVVIDVGYAFLQTYWVFYEFSLPCNIISLCVSPWFKQYSANSHRHRPSLRNMSSRSTSTPSGGNRGSNADIMMSLPRLSTNKQMSSSSGGSSPHPVIVKLENILSSETGIKIFCRHLCKEFSLENILFLMETQQLWDSIAVERIENSNDESAPVTPLISDDFKLIDSTRDSFGARDSKISIFNGKRESKSRSKRESKSRTKRDSNISITGRDTKRSSHRNTRHLSVIMAAPPKIGKIRIRFHPSMPKSEIVFNDDHSRLLQFCLIFEKYIRNDALFCCNLSSRVRNQLYILFRFNGRAYVILDDSGNEIDTTDSAESALKDFEIDKFVSQFCKARREIYNLLFDAFGRFKNSPEFGEWCSATKSKSEM